MEDVAAFLANVPPFDRLTAEERERVARSVETRSFEAGDDVLVEDGPPARYFYVIRSGSMELLHDNELIDILGAGEAFGHPSLLTGLAPAFTVRAHEPSVCYLLPKTVAVDVLSRPAGVRFVATTFRERLVRTGHTVHALPELRSLRLEALLRRAPLEVDPDAPVREVAARMSEAHVSAALVRGRDGLGLVTDESLRERIIAANRPLDTPAAEAMAPAPLTASVDDFALEAVVDMLEAGAHHLPVLDRRGRVVGILSAEELLELEGRSPFAVRRALMHARDEAELVQEARRLPRMFLSLLETGLPVLDVGRVLALQADAATSRLIDFAIGRHGPPPVAWAWLALGSTARRELTLASDQDNALAYDDASAADGGPSEQAIDAYFARLAADVTAGLARCGFGHDRAEVLASNRLWRMSRSAWIATIEACLDQPDRSHLLRAVVSFDFRHAAGGLDIVPALVERLREAQHHPDFLARLARTATDVRPALRFRGRFAVDGGGHSGTIDIKHGGVLPIVNLARFHAIAHGVTISRTLDRLTAVEEVGALDAETARALREAFVILWTIRLEHHAHQVAAGTAPDDFVDPTTLPPLARVELREALRAIQSAQKQLSRYVPLGM